MNVLKAIVEFILVIHILLFLFGSVITKQPVPTIVGIYVRTTQEMFRVGYNSYC